MGRRYLSPEDAADIGRLDADAVARVCEEAWPDPANADELHDSLVWLGFATDAEVMGPARPNIPMPRRSSRLRGEPLPPLAEPGPTRRVDA